jgi:nematocidal protein AidA
MWEEKTTSLIVSTIRNIGAILFMSSQEFASSQEINVLVVIDTEQIKKDHPNPSKDMNNPTGINHKNQFMIVTGSRGLIGGQGTADLHFKANAGDYLSFRGISVHGNSDDAVIVYGIKYNKGDQVFNPFQANIVTRNRAVMPDPRSPNHNGLPPLHAQMTFSSYDTKIARSGTENFNVWIALFTLADDGQTQELFGYFWWDPAVTVPA